MCGEPGVLDLPESGLQAETDLPRPASDRFREPIPQLPLRFSKLRDAAGVRAMTRKTDA